MTDTIDTITITAGSKQGAYRGEKGNLPGTLVTHTLEGPFESKQKPGEKFRLHEWGFAIYGAPEGAEMVWVRSGEATGPKSKTYGIISALLAGRTIPPGTSLDINKHLIGRMGLVMVEENEQGYLDGKNVTAMPTALLQQLSPAGAAADTRAAAPAPAPVPVATANPDDLPF